MYSCAKLCFDVVVVFKLRGSHTPLVDGVGQKELGRRLRNSSQNFCGRYLDPIRRYQRSKKDTVNHPFPA